MSLLEPRSDYRSLSLVDLLDAREQYQVHLMSKRNVVGTAVGLYLIRNDDPWPTADEPGGDTPDATRPPRTLGSSSVRPYSWPAVLVFVERWVGDDEFTGRYVPTDAVPKTLYLADGRTIPVCVVLVERAEIDVRDEQPTPSFPAGQLGGGFPLTVRTQEVVHQASVGCLVSDGHTLYALTNRHVSGRPGARIAAILRGAEREIGTSSDLQLTRRPFTDVYPELPGSHSHLTLDVGLVEVDDAGLDEQRVRSRTRRRDGEPHRAEHRGAPHRRARRRVRRRVRTTRGHDQGTVLPIPHRRRLGRRRRPVDRPAVRARSRRGPATPAPCGTWRRSTRTTTR